MTESSIHPSLRTHWPVLLAVVLMIGLVLALCARLIFSAYTSGDDGYTTMAALEAHGIWASAKQMALFQGRFYQLAVYPLAMLPFASANTTVTNLFRVYTFLVFLGGFVALCRELFGWRGAACCTALFLCLFDTVGGSYNAFHGLPLWFGLGYGLLLYSLAMHVRALDRGESSALAYALFGVALLTYEVVLLYAPVFVFMMLYYLARGSDRNHWLGPSRLMIALRASVPVIVYCSLYLILYAVFRHFYPGTYSGADGLTFAPLASMIKPVIEFSWHSLYWHLGSMGNTTFSCWSALFAFAGVAAVGLCLWHDGKHRLFDSRPALAPTLAAIALLAIYVLIPNLLFGFTERYRIWAGDGVQIYLGSMLSAVALVMLLYLLLRRLWNVATSRMLGQLFALAGLFLLFSLTYANSKNSENFFGQSERMSIRWTVANWAAAKLSALSGTDGVVANANICEKGFTHNTELFTYFRNPDMIADADIFWSRYFTRKMGRTAQLVNDPTGSRPDCVARLELSYTGNEASLDYAGKRDTLHFGSP